MHSFQEYRDLLTSVKHSDGLKELLFFIFVSPSKTYRYKINRELKTAEQCLQEREPDAKLKQYNVLKAIILFIMVILLLGQSTGAQVTSSPSFPGPERENLLFSLQRSNDDNIVIYELNFKSNGQLDSRKPVKATWIKQTENGSYRHLINIERHPVYGITCKPLRNPVKIERGERGEPIENLEGVERIGDPENTEDEVFEIRLIAYKKLPLYLKKSQDDNKYKIYIKDAAKDYLLKRVFVKINGGSFRNPKFEYIDLIIVNKNISLEKILRNWN